MKPLRIDFSQVPELEPIPTGMYSAVITDIEVRESKSGKDPYLNWTFEITNPEFLGRKVWLVTGLGVSALWKLREVLESLGESVPDGPFNLNLENYISRRCKVMVTQETYNGRIQNRVESVYPADPRTVR